MSIVPDEEDQQKNKGNVSDDEETWPLWKLCMIALPQMGVQVLWMFLGPNTTPYLVSLGASESFATLNNSAGPIVGFFVGPLVGAWSDQSTSKWGRRRPIMVAGLLSTCVAGILYSGSERFTGKGNGMYLAAVMQWVLDFTINAMQTPYRALVADLASPRQQLPMQIFFAVVCAIGCFLAFSMMKLYDVAIHHMFELMGITLAINVVCVGIALSVAREKPFVRTGKASASACGPIIGMCTVIKGLHTAFYILLFVQCMAWLGNSVWGFFGKVWFTSSVFPGDPEAPLNSTARDIYVEGADAFSTGGQIGSFGNLVLSLLIMGIGMTSFPSHLVYVPCLFVGSIVCFLCAFVVGQNHNLAIACFVLSNIPLTAAGSIPYGIVAMWNKAAEQAGNVGSVALQMALLNCCITVGQQLCTLTLGALETSYDVTESLKYIFILGMVTGALAGIGALFLNIGSPAQFSTADTESEESSSNEG